MTNDELRNLIDLRHEEIRQRTEALESSNGHLEAIVLMAHSRMEEIESALNKLSVLATSLGDVERMSDRVSRIERFVEAVTAGGNASPIAEQLATKSYVDDALARFSTAVHKRIDRELAGLAQKKSTIMARIRAVIAAALGTSPGLPPNQRNGVHVTGLS